MDSNDAEYDRIMSLSNKEATCDLEKIFQELQRIKAETGRRREQLARELLEDKLQQQSELNKILADMLESAMRKLARNTERLKQLVNEQMQMEEEEQSKKSLAEKAAVVAAAAAEPSTAITPDMKFVTPEQSSSSNEQISSVSSCTKKQPVPIRVQGNSASCTTTNTNTMPEPEPSKSKSTTLPKSTGSGEEQSKKSLAEKAAVAASDVAKPSTAITPDIKFVTPEQSSSSNEQISSVSSCTKKQPVPIRVQGNSASCTTTNTNTMPKREPNKSKSTTLPKSSGSWQSTKKYTRKFTRNEELVEMGKTFGNQRSELLVMCQKIMRPYGIPMYEFSASWVDGHAYCALIHHYLPDLVDSRYLLCKDTAVTLLYVSELCKSLGVEFEGNMMQFYKLKKPDYVKTCSFVLKLVSKLEDLVNLIEPLH